MKKLKKWLLSLCIFLGLAMMKFLRKQENGEANVLPSYIAAVKGNNLQLYSEVEGTLNGKIKFTVLSKRFATRFLAETRNIKKHNKENREKLNYHIWQEICDQGIESLLYNPTFPYLPTLASYLGNLNLDYIERNSGIRIFGYLLFSQTANYQLSLNTQYAIVHVWFSKDKAVENSKLLFNANSPLQNNMSNIFNLKANVKYFIDIIIKTGNVQGSFQLQWIHQDGVKAPSNIGIVTFTPFYETLYNFHDKVSKLPMLINKKEIPELYEKGNNQLRWQSLLLPFIEDEKVHDLFPICDYQPSYLQKGEIKNEFQGIWETHLTSVYPDDDTNLTFKLKSSNLNQILPGNPVLDQAIAEEVVNRVMESLEQRFPS